MHWLWKTKAQLVKNPQEMLGLVLQIRDCRKETGQRTASSYKSFNTKRNIRKKLIGNALSSGCPIFSQSLINDASTGACLQKRILSLSRHQYVSSIVWLQVLQMDPDCAIVQMFRVMDKTLLVRSMLSSSQRLILYYQTVLPLVLSLISVIFAISFIHHSFIFSRLSFCLSTCWPSWSSYRGRGFTSAVLFVCSASTHITARLSYTCRLYEKWASKLLEKQNTLN